MIANAVESDVEATQVSELFASNLNGRLPDATCEAERYLPTVIRLRVTSGHFAGLDIGEREAAVEEAFAALPENLYTQIGTTVLITPEERAATPAGPPMPGADVPLVVIRNYEFENPDYVMPDA